MMWMPEYYLAAVLLIALCIYMLTAGADFGGGVLDLIATGPRASQQRDLISRTLAPIWESNHVWLILIIVLLFVCFPPAFEVMSLVLHIPITLMLVGIVLRGSAFVFRSHDFERQARRWSIIFAIGSIITPVMLGIVLGTVSSGQIPTLPSPVLSDGELTLTRSALAFQFEAYFIKPWLQLFPILLGVLTLCLCSLLSALSLLRRADTQELQDDFRKRALGFALLTGIFAFAALLAARTGATHLYNALLHQTWSPGFQVLTALAALTVFASLFLKHYKTAQIAGMAQAICMVAGWALSQFPYLIVDTHTILDSASPHAILNPVLVALGMGAFALVPSFIWLYWLFGRQTSVPNHK